MSELKFGFIGIGNAGNQVVSNLFEHGYENVLAINTSEKDLNRITEGIQKMFIGRLGSAKERDISKEYIKKHYQKILSKGNNMVQSLISQTDIIFICSSTGGGTGSGMTPILTDMFKNVFKNKMFINIAIFPDDTDDIKSFTNTMEYIKEIKNLELTLLPYSNSNAIGDNITEKMKYINNQILEDINVLSGVYCPENDFSMIDDRDMLKLINTKGITRISKITSLSEKDLDKESFDVLMLNAMDKSPFIELDKDRIQKRMGMIINVDTKVLNKIDRNYEILKQHIGTPIEVFENINVDDNSEYAAICIQAGLTYPNDLIEIYYEKVSELEDLINQHKEIDSDKLDEVSLYQDNSFNINLNSNIEDNDINLDNLNFDTLFKNY